jgi:hypothetical protein
MEDLVLELPLLFVLRHRSQLEQLYASHGPLIVLFVDIFLEDKEIFFFNVFVGNRLTYEAFLYVVWCVVHRYIPIENQNV